MQACAAQANGCLVLSEMDHSTPFTKPPLSACIIAPSPCQLSAVAHSPQTGPVSSSASLALKPKLHSFQRAPRPTALRPGPRKLLAQQPPAPSIPAYPPARRPNRLADTNVRPSHDRRGAEAAGVRGAARAAGAGRAAR